MIHGDWKRCTAAAALLLLLVPPGASALQSIETEREDPLENSLAEAVASILSERVVGFCTDVARCDTLKDGAAPCRLWEWYDDEVHVSVDPLLGLIVLDPDGCLAQKVDDLGDMVLEIVG